MRGHAPPHTHPSGPHCLYPATTPTQRWRSWWRRHKKEKHKKEKHKKEKHKKKKRKASSSDSESSSSDEAERKKKKHKKEKKEKADAPMKLSNFFAAGSDSD